MRNVLQFGEADPILSKYYEDITDCMDKSIADCNRMQEMFSQETPSTFKPRTKGSLIADRLKVHFTQAFASNPHVRLVEIKGIFGLIIEEQFFLRFNKMDENFVVSINKKTGQSKKYYTQADIPGFPPNVTLLQGGYTPDRAWSKINGYYLTCYNGGLQWHYDMGRHKVTQQLSLDILKPEPKTEKRRVTPKKKGDLGKTGTSIIHN